MPSKRHQQFIYNSNSYTAIHPLRGIKTEQKQSDVKRDSKDLSSNISHSLQNIPDTQNESTGHNSKDGKINIRKYRPLPLIPPVQYADKHVPRHIVTIDTSKARGNLDVVRLATRDLGWREFHLGRREHNCDVIWHAISYYDQTDLFSGQVNKFPGSLESFHKVALFRQLEFMKHLYPNDFNFFPRTWVLPQQFHEFCSEARQMADKKTKPKPTFIIKPSEGSQGDGIYLLREPQNFAGHSGRAYVAQEYLTNVLLIDGYKFDLRVYVVLKSLDPLEMHICNEGLARFSTILYENPTTKNLHETFMHLTNYSLNKRSSTFNKSDKEDEGSKRKMTSVFRRMQRMGHDTGALWKEIERIVCKTIVAMAGELKVEYQSAMPPGKPHPSCFQILGFDILVLKDLRPMLLEVNSNPSLSITGEKEVSPGVVEYVHSIKDEEVKRALIRDTLILIAPKHKRTRRRRHRKKTHLILEEMDVDSSSSPKLETRHRNHRRERDISIRFTGDDKPSLERQKSIFAENDKTHHTYVRQETCRVFIEGEGEVTNFEPPPHLQPRGEQAHFSSFGRNQSWNASSLLVMDAGDSQSSEALRPRPETFSEMLLEDGDHCPRTYNQDTFVEFSDEEEEEEQSCLKEIFPAVYADEMKHMRVMERIAEIFINGLSVRGCLRLGPTAFRTFARKSRLNRKGMTNAAIDILYIDMQRKWETVRMDRTAGLCFQGFIDACIEIARRKFYSPNRSEMFDSFLSYCEENLRRKSAEDGTYRKLSLRILRPPRHSVTLFPRRTITSLEEETIHNLFDKSVLRRNQSFITDVNTFMNNRQTYSSTSQTFLNSEE